MEESITQLLDAWRDGDRNVENALINRVYPMLYAIAQAQLRRPNDPITLSTTDLLHEAYERLVQQKPRLVVERHLDRHRKLSFTLGPASGRR